MLVGVPQTAGFCVALRGIVGLAVFALLLRAGARCLCVVRLGLLRTARCVLFGRADRVGAAAIVLCVTCDSVLVLVSFVAAVSG